MDHQATTLDPTTERLTLVPDSSAIQGSEETLSPQPSDHASASEVQGVIVEAAPDSEPSISVDPTRLFAHLARYQHEHQAIWLGAIAFLVGGLGESLLFSEDSRGLGTGILGLGMLLAIIAWRSTRDKPLWNSEARIRASELDVTVRLAPWWHIAWRPALALRLIGVIAALGLEVGAIRAYTDDPQAIFGLQGMLWLFSMALLLISCVKWPSAGKSKLVQSLPSNEVKGSTFNVQNNVTSLNLEPGTLNNTEIGPPWTRREVLAFVGLIALSLFTHLAFLEQIPWRFHFDEGFAYIEVMHFYKGPMIPLFTTTWEGTTLPSLLFGLEGLLAHIVGPGLVGVRLGVALAGAVTVIPVYALARLSWGRLAAMLSGFGVSVSAMYVHYSRVSILNVTTPLWWAGCFYFLLRGLRSRRPLDFALAGLLAGTSMYTYYGTRLLPMLLLAFAIYLLVFHFRAFRERIAHWALLVVGFVVGFGPLLGYFIVNPSTWFSRSIAFLNVPATIPTTWEGWVNDWNVLAPLVGQNFLGLSVIPGRDTVYYAPFLLPPEAVLVILGAGLLIWRWRQPASFLVLLWGLSVVLTGGTLLDYTTIPNFARWSPAFPAFFLAMSLPLALWTRALLRFRGPKFELRSFILRRRVIAGALTLVLIADLGANLYSYLVLYPPKVPPPVSLQALQGRYVASVGPNTRIRVMGDTWTWDPLNAPISQMMAAPNTFQTRFFNSSRELPVVGDPTHDLAFVFYSDMVNYIPLIENLYPGGQKDELRTPGSDVIGTSYRIPADKAVDGYGVILSIGDPDTGQSLWTGKVDRVGIFPPDVDMPKRFLGTWTGNLYVSGDASSAIKFSTSGMQGTPDIRVLGEPVSPGAAISVEPGWVRFSVRALFKLPLATSADLLIQLGDLSPPVEVDKYHLWPSTIDQGLRVTLGGEPVEHRIDPFVASNFSRPAGVGTNDLNLDPEALPLASIRSNTTYTRWEGEMLTQEGTYTMMLRTDAIARLWIDGKTVVRQCIATEGNRPPTAAGQAQLAAGWHAVQVDFTPGSNRSGLEWFWTRPDGVTEVVPPSAFRIGPDVTPDSPFPAWPLLPASTCGGGQ